MKQRFMVCKMTITQSNLVKLSREGLNIAVSTVTLRSDFDDKQLAIDWITNNKDQFRGSEKPSIVEYFEFD